MPGSEHDHAREQFLAEAQELVEGLSRDVLLLEQEKQSGEPNPDLLNDLFRGVHTLKGLSGMFDHREVGRLAHVLEDLLEQLRMGRVSLTPETLDLLFSGIEAFQRLLASSSAGPEMQSALVDPIAERVDAVTQNAISGQPTLDDYTLDPATLAVLTEYEEHRLRTNVARGHALYRLTLHVALDAIETTLDDMKRRVQPRGEIVSFLPSSEPSRAGEVALELLIASGAPPAELAATLADSGGKLVAVDRRSEARKPAAALVATSTVPPRVSARPAASPPPPEPRARGAQLSLRSLTSVVRVEIRKLDHLMNAVGELGTVRNAVGKLLEKMRSGATHADLVLEAQRVHRSFDRHLGVVQDAVLEVRMVPLSQLFDKLAVVVRQLAREQNKQVQLLVRGAETEVDKLIAEDIADPLVHLVRNAVDHGIESSGERADKGKVSTGSVRVHAYQKGNQVVIEVKDDGRGITPKTVRDVAVERGLLEREQASDLSDREVLGLIFLPGFSTSTQVSDISGRGVGMDVVRTNVQRLGGSVEVESEPGTGTTFIITLPITLAIIGALVFSVRGRTMALPLAVVSEVVKLDARLVRTVEGREVLDLRGATLPLCRLGDLLRMRVQDDAARELHVIVLLVGNRRLALVVDRLLSQQDVVIKPLGPSLHAVRGIAGATDLGDQQLVLVLDATSLIDEVLAGKSARLGVGGQV